MTQSHPTLLDDYLTSWKKAFLTDLTTFDLSHLRLFLGIRVGIMVIIPMTIGLLINSTMVAVLASLGVFYLSIPEGFPTKWSTKRVLSVTCLVNPVVFAIATLIGLTGPVAALLFGLGFFLLSYLRMYRNAIPILFVAAVALAVGVGYPGGSVAAALERFWLFLGGGLFGLLGAFVSMQLHSKKSASQNKTQSEDYHSSFEEKLRPLAKDRQIDTFQVLARICYHRSSRTGYRTISRS